MEQKKKLFFLYLLFLVLIFVIIINLFLYFKLSKVKNLEIVEIKGFGNINILKKENATFRQTEIILNCTKDEDCNWIITNCCNEESGAQWQCLNKNSYIDCQSKLVLCPNVSIPKPKEGCRCVNYTCQGLVFIIGK
jgi:hypothetical protein